MDDLISRQAAITLPVMPKEYREYQTFNLDDAYEQGWNDLQKCIEALPSAQPERPFEIQDILDYLDTVLHPIISPDYWNVYSELYDMISMLPPEERHGQWKDIPFTARWICSNCDYISEFASFKYCPDCGARMDLEEYK